MEWKALMAYLSNNHFRTSFFYFLSPDAPASGDIHRFYQGHSGSRKQFKKIKQELINL
jgi:hypothetical protein